MRTITTLFALILLSVASANAQFYEDKLKRLYGCLYEQSCRPGNQPTGEIEKKFFVNGPWRVLERTTDVECDSFHNKCTLFHPDFQAADQKHPVITWGNGTLAHPSSYAYFMRHLASWGFIVIATQEQRTLTNGKGSTILDAVQFLLRANNDATMLDGSFYGKIDSNNIGAVGHSQGAGGAIAAAILANGLIKTVVPIELPSALWCSENCFDIRNLTHSSIFLITGSLDFISPPIQQPGVAGLQSMEAYYHALPASVIKLMGTLNGPSHNDVIGQPGCGSQILCTNGVYGYLGYPTAWLMFQLQGDAVAGKAFVHPTGEMFLQKENWSLVESTLVP